jgi:hypothetical protein
LRTTARMTAFNPGQSPPPVNMPIFIVCSYGRQLFVQLNSGS